MPTVVTLDKKFTDNIEAKLEISAPDAADVAQAIATNQPLPRRQINLGKISAKASASTGTITFGSGAGKVSFQADGGGFAGLGIYPDPTQLLQSLGLNDNIAPGMRLTEDPSQLYLALRWGYNLSASGKGSMALGAPGMLTFGASGKKDALYAVVRRLANETKALSALESIAQGWMLPAQIGKTNDLAPGTWLIAQVDGAFVANLGVTYGYDFNWVREGVQLGTLQGDIALRLQLGVSAALSFQAGGNYAVVVSRETEAGSNIRLRLFKMRQKGWGFAFDAGATVTGSTGDFLPGEFDDFLKAVFGLHGAQVLKDLKLIEKWTNPENDLAELFGAAGIDHVKKFIKDITGLDPETAFETAKERVLSFLKLWEKLPHRVATKLWKLVEEKIDFTELRQFVGQIADANRDTARSLLEEKLKDVDFFRTPVGRWLESAAVDGVLSALAGFEEFAKLQKIAGLTRTLLDGSALETLLVNLHKLVAEKLDLDKWLKLSRVADLKQLEFDQIDEWLKKRLTDFLGSNLDLAKANAIRAVIFKFIERGRSFYEKAVAALNRSYQFDFSYTYQKNTASTALFDLEFDLAQPTALRAYKKALSGAFDDLLITSQTGVKLNLGALTHEIKRHAHVEINLPWSKSALDQINTSLARVNAVDQDQGRVLIYELEAKDVAEERNKRLSRLTVGGNFLLNTSANQVRVFETGALKYGYSYRQVKKKTKRADLVYQLNPLVQTYFRNLFTSSDGSFINWIGDLDNELDAKLGANTDNFGKTLVNLELSVSDKTLAAWLNAPPENGSGANKAVYMEMSRQIQARLKQLIPFYYFQNLDNFKTIGPPTALLVYAAIPPSTSVKIDGSTLTINRDKDYYWNFPDVQERHIMARSPLTAARLAPMLERAFNLLQEAGHEQTAELYRPNRVNKLQEAGSSGNNDILLNSLLFNEVEAIKSARRAGFALAKFTTAAEAKPSEAVKELANFGAKVTATFNRQLSGTFGDEASRPLGTALFLAACRALAPGLEQDTLALLDVSVVKPESTFDLAAYLSGQLPPKADVLTAQRLIDIA